MSTDKPNLVAIRALSPIDHDNHPIPEGGEAEIDETAAKVLVDLGRAEYLDPAQAGAPKKGKGK